MATACPFGVVGVDAAIFEGGDGVLHKSGFVQRVGVNGDLHIVLVGNAEAGVDRGWRCAPVFVQFQPHGSRFHLFHQCLWLAGVALTQKAQVHREGIGGLQHPVHIPGAGGAGGGVGACGRACAAANHGGDPRGDRHLNLLGADEVNVGVDAASGEDHPFASDRLRPRANDNVHIVLNVRVPGLTNGSNFAILNPHIGLDNAPPIQNQRVGDHGVHRSGGIGNRRLPHAIPDHLPTPELDLIAIGGVVPLHLNDQFGVGQTDAITHRGAKGFGVGTAIHPVTHGAFLIN